MVSGGVPSEKIVLNEESIWSFDGEYSDKKGAYKYVKEIRQLLFDGNFGGCAGIIEMLVQSHSGEIELLPALPDAWKDGEVKGVKVRGGFEIDIKWEKGQLVSTGIKFLAGKQCRLLYNENV